MRVGRGEELWAAVNTALRDCSYTRWFTRCRVWEGEGGQRCTPAKIVLRWAFSDLFFLFERKTFDNSQKIIGFSNFAVQLELLRQTTFFCLGNSTDICPKWLMLVWLSARPHGFTLVQVWGQYFLSTLRYEFLKNDTLLDSWSGTKRTEKQDELFTNSALRETFFYFGSRNMRGREWRARGY